MKQKWHAWSLGATFLFFLFTSVASAYVYPQYPDILTNKDWQKKKGTIAKMAGETGMGDQLKKLEAAFKKIKFEQMDAMNILTGANRTKENLEKFREDAKKYWNSDVKPCWEEARKTSDFAGKLAAEWKKKKTIPSKSREHVEAIEKAAGNLMVTLKSLDNLVLEPSIKKATAEAAKNEEKARKMLEGWITSIKTKAKAVDKNPTVETWRSELHQKIRGLGTAVGSIPELKKKWSPVWNQYSSDGFVLTAKNMDEKAIKKKLDEVLGELKKFESDIK